MMNVSSAFSTHSCLGKDWQKFWPGHMQSGALAVIPKSKTHKYKCQLRSWQAKMARWGHMQGI